MFSFCRSRFFCWLFYLELLWILTLWVYVWNCVFSIVQQTIIFIWRLQRFHQNFHMSASQLENPVRRKCSPLLESALLPGGNGLTTHDWMAVPDIWRTAAEKYADRVALVDPYHEPPSELTYKQVHLWTLLTILFISDDLDNSSKIETPSRQLYYMVLFSYCIVTWKLLP